MLLGLLALLVGCSKSEDVQVDSEVITTVGEQTITEGELTYWLARFGMTDSPANREEVLQRLIQRKAFVQQALDKGLGDDEIVKASHETALIGRLKELLLMPAIAEVEVSQDDLRTAYENQKERFSVPESVVPAVLWLNSRGQAHLEKLYFEKLDEFLKNFKKNLPALEEGFGEASVSLTEHRQSRFRGGILEPLELVPHTDNFRNAVVEITENLSLGELSEVTVRPDGVFLVRLLSRQEATSLTFESVEETLRDEIRRQRIVELEADFEAEALRRIEVTPIVLKN